MSCYLWCILLNNIYCFIRKTGSIGFSRRNGFIYKYNGLNMVSKALDYRSKYGHIFTNAYTIINYSSEGKHFRAEEVYNNVFLRYGIYEY